jgi:proline dehydrogenase
VEGATRLPGSLSQSLLRRTTQSARLKSAIEGIRPARRAVGRYVAGATQEDAIRVAGDLAGEQLMVAVEYLGAEVRDGVGARRVADAYISLLNALHQAGLSSRAEVSVKPSVLGRALPGGDEIVLDHARRVCAAAHRTGSTVTLDMEDHTTTDSTLAILHQLRLDFPETGVVLQACLRRTEGDCRDLSYAGSRIRLCKGAYDEPAGVAFTDRVPIDRE